MTKPAGPPLQIPALRVVRGERKSPYAVQSAPVARAPTESKVERKDRMAICESCDKAKKSPFGLRCMECGCVCRLKTALPAAKCPLGKW